MVVCMFLMDLAGDGTDIMVMAEMLYTMVEEEVDLLIIIHLEEEITIQMEEQTLLDQISTVPEAHLEQEKMVQDQM